MFFVGGSGPARCAPAGNPSAQPFSPRPRSTAGAHIHGLPPLAVVCVDRKTGEPSRGNVGFFRLDKNRERVFNYDWFALVPPTPEEIREAHLAQNPPPTTSTKAREAGTTPQMPDRG